MSGIFDFYTVLLLVIAVAIILKLRSVLGRRTGHERTPAERMQAREQERAQRGARPTDNVVPMPRSSGEMGGATRTEVVADAEARIRDFMPETNPATFGLIEIARGDPSFDPKHFIQGARSAYEMIVTSFAEGNKRLLKQFLSKEVFDGFADAIAKRESRGEAVDTSFVGIDKADIIDAELKNRTARVTVKFVSQLITAIRNRNGEIIEGDPKQIREVTDIWTFAREVSSKDPNWKLVATQAAN
ncbi:MAG: Tim44/TimA family putative adaptor protein [Hyphomicrobiaceae bacterium]